MYYDDSIITFLTTLGWNRDDFVRDGEHRTEVQHPIHTRLHVRRPNVRNSNHYNTRAFVLAPTIGRDLPDGLKIEQKLFHIDRPQWQKAVMLWFTRSVFTMEQVLLNERNRQAEREAKALRHEAAVHAMLPDDCKVAIEDLDRICSVYFKGDDVASVSMSHYMQWRLPEDLTDQQKLAKLARLTRFFIEEGFTHI